MSYRERREGHYMSIAPFLSGARYITCSHPGCMRVRRRWDAKPLIHKGGRYRG